MSLIYNCPYGALSPIAVFIAGILFVANVSGQGTQDSITFYTYDKNVKENLFNNPDSTLFIIQQQLEFARSKKVSKWESEAINNMGNCYYLKNDFDEAEKYYLQNLELQTATNNEAGLAKTYNNLGNIAKEHSDYTKAKEYYFKSFYYYETLGDVNGVSYAYTNLGIAFDEQGDYPRALEYHFKALRISEKTNNKKGLGISYNNIAIIYKQQKKYEKALEYNYKSLEIRKELNLQYDIATSYNNIANIFTHQNKYKEALDYYEQALKISQSLNDIQMESMLENNIGSVYVHLKEYDKAKKYFEKSLKSKIEIDEIQGQVQALTNLGKLHKEINEYEKTVKYCKESYELASKHKLISELADVCDCLYRGYRTLNNNTEAIKYLEEHKRISDTLESIDNKRFMIEKEFEYMYDKKTSEDSLKNETHRQILQTQIDKERVQKYSLYGGILMVLLFAGFIYNRFKLSQKQKHVIEVQKELVELKNHEITQSIQYAQRIQSALLPSEKEFQKILPESFVLFRPKDIVSGDYYWISDKEEYIFYATADCTGHGVPGGFMSMLGTALLNEIIDERKIEDCGEVLTLMREKIMQALKQAGDSESKDGMDMVLIRINKKTVEMQYAAANNSMYVVSNKQSAISKEYCILQTADCQFFELPCDKMPVGVYHSEVKPFRTYTHQVQKGDIIYTYTDGYADQFGGEKGKKYTYKRLRENLLAISQEPLDKQKNILDSEFENWKGNNEQIDDVCLIGVKV